MQSRRGSGRTGRWAATGLRSVLALVLALGCAVMAAGQAQNTGSVSGNILDAQGKVVVGATISLVDTVNGAERTTTSNTKGEYLFSDVAVGNYNLTVTSEGFESYVVQAIQVDAMRTSARTRS